MNISRKLGLWTLSVMSVVVVFSLYAHYRMMTDEEIERIEFLGNTLGPVIEAAISESMHTGDNALLGGTLRKLADIESIAAIRIVDEAGVVKAGTAVDDPGKSMPIPGTLYPQYAEKRRRFTALKEEGLFRWVQPVKNRPECRSCHDPAKPYNGAIVIDFSTREVGKLTERHIAKETVAFFASLAVAGFSMFFLSNVFVIKRLKATVGTMKRFKEGDYGVRMQAAGNDELAELGGAFNAMAEEIAGRDREKNVLINKISASQKEWQSTFDCIKDLVSIHDRDLRIIRANKAVADYFDLPIRDVIDKKCHDLFHGTCSPPENCPHLISLRENRAATEEVRGPRSGSLLRVSTFPYYTPEGEFIGSVHVARDITHERQREMRLITSERLASLGQMASGIAHEINNPLAAIAGCAEGLLRRLEQGEFDQELYRTYLKIIDEEISRCKTITTGILSFVRRAPAGQEDVDVNRTVEKALEIIDLQGRLMTVDVIRKLRDGLGPVHGNEGELRQVFLAVITNALDAMEDKGALTIETGAEDDKIFITINDTGPGVPPEHIGRLFDPFFTTKAGKGGTGLGLSIAYRIVADHHGAIEATSETGKGATFKITLPA